MMNVDNSSSSSLRESYAAIDRIEDDYAVLEIELHSIKSNEEIPFPRRDCYMADVLLATLIKTLGQVKEGDVLIVQHDETQVIPIRLAPEEKEARIEFLKKLIG